MRGGGGDWGGVIGEVGLGSGVVTESKRRKLQAV